MKLKARLPLTASAINTNDTRCIGRGGRPESRILVRGFLTAVTLIAVAATAGMTGAPARAEELSKQELAKISQNPIGNLISVPIENDFNFNVGPNRGLLNVVKFEPVIPISVNQDWNVITRTILPLISAPSVAPTAGAVTGLGDLQFSSFLSPANPGDLIWGFGSIVQVPTHTNATLGNDNLGLGPTAVLLHTQQGQPVGVRSTRSTTSGRSAPARPRQPTATACSSLSSTTTSRMGSILRRRRIVTMNWLAATNQQLTLPLGGGIGKIFHIGKLPVNASSAAYQCRPDCGPDWQLRAQIQFMFPK